MQESPIGGLHIKDKYQRVVTLDEIVFSTTRLLFLRAVNAG